MKNLAHNFKILGLSAAVAAGTDGAVVTCTEIDSKGFQSCLVVAELGTVSASGLFTMAVKGSNTSATYGSGTVDRMQDRSSSASTVANTAGSNSNKFLAFDVFQPGRRYLRAEYQRTGGNVVIKTIFAILYNGEYGAQGLVGDLVAALTTGDPAYLAA